MPQNDFLPFATAPDANVSPQSEYAALALLKTGFSSGVARSLQMNKVWRQSSIMSAVLAAFIVEQSGQAAIDDGTTATLKANLLDAINGAVSNSFASKTGLQQDLYTSAIATGTADAIVAAFSPAITSTTLASGSTTLTVRATAANVTTAPTFTPNSGVVAAATIVKGANQALAAGDIAGAGHWITLQWDAALSKWVLLNPATGVAVTKNGYLSGQVGINATYTIPATQIGSMFEIVMAGIVVTLPMTAVGGRLFLMNLSGGPITIASASGSQIYIYGLGSQAAIVVQNSNYIEMTCDGSNWIITSTYGPQYPSSLNGSRVVGATYTNTGYRRRRVAVSVSQAGGQWITGVVAGIAIAETSSTTANLYGNVIIDVDPGQTYQIQQGGPASTLLQWTEIQ